ncbi:MAG TPA: SDR family oxidoreductase [Vicinamibacterales bacterium]|nr:SDR family oxidoreductase [Vicinamibacterales bacterium]
MHSSDRLALITGTSRGIGAAVADRLIERGWNVVGIARRDATLDHPRYRHLHLDLAESAALAEKIERELGTLVSDSRWRRVGLVNNAAIGSALGPVEQIDPVELARLGAVNWIAPTWLMGFVVRRARADAALRIVNVSSGAATSARLGAAGYSGSKAAINMLTEALAIELGPHGIRVNAVAPGLVTDTALSATDSRLTPYMRMMLEMTPLGRTGAPADIAEVIVFVASERNAWMTGSIVDVSGGSHTGRPHVPLPRPPE